MQPGVPRYEIKKEISMTIEEAGSLFSRFIIPIIFITITPFIIFHGFAYFRGFELVNVLILLTLLIPGIILHELIHGLVFGVASKGGFRSISFGIDPKTFSPYCHCASTISVLSYRTGVLMPLIVLGLIPVVCSWIFGNGNFLVFGTIFSLFSGGDLVAVYLTRELKHNEKIIDHPAKLGFYVLA